NHAPVVRSLTVDPTTVRLGGTARITADVIDPDGDPLFCYYQATQGGGTISQPDKASCTVTVTYTQDGTAHTDDRVVLTASDSWNAPTIATRNIKIQGNRPPEVDVSGGGSCHPPCSVSFSIEATDPDGDPLDIHWSGCASGTNADATCEVTSIGENLAIVIAA